MLQINKDIQENVIIYDIFLTGKSNSNISLLFLFGIFTPDFYFTFNLNKCALNTYALLD